MATTEQLVARVTHRFDAPAETVFDAWITSAKIRKWFAPGLGEMVRVAVDARVGGSFSFVQRRGMDDIDHFGKYLEFDRASRLAFTWQVRGTQDARRVFVAIADAAGGCEVTVAHELSPAWANYVDRTQAAWTKMLNAMTEALK